MSNQGNKVIYWDLNNDFKKTAQTDSMFRTSSIFPTLAQTDKDRLYESRMSSRITNFFNSFLSRSSRSFDSVVEESPEDFEEDAYWERLLQNETDGTGEEDWTKEYFWAVVLIIVVAALLLAVLAYLCISGRDNASRKESAKQDAPFDFSDQERGIVLEEEHAFQTDFPSPPAEEMFPGMKYKVVNEEGLRNSIASSTFSLGRETRLSTMSGRDSGKFVAISGKDDNLQYYTRDKRHEHNVRLGKMQAAKNAKKRGLGRLSRSLSVASKQSQKPKAAGKLETVEVSTGEADTLKDPEFKPSV